MRNLEAVQQGLRVVRDALTPLVEKILTSEYGNHWWKKGVLDALEKDGKPIHDRPVQGDAGDLDLQLALKLVQVYHWKLFSDDMGWSGRQRSLLAAVTAVRNQYEGHVTPNREAELTDCRTKDLLEGMELFVNLFDKKAGEKIGNIIELMKMQQPEPELPDEGEVVILRRPVLQSSKNDPVKSDPERKSYPIHIPKPETVLPNGAAGKSIPEQAVPLWQRKKQVNWGQAVKNPQNHPIETEDEIPQENRIDLHKAEPVENMAAGRVLKTTEPEEIPVKIPRPPVTNPQRKSQQTIKGEKKKTEPKPMVDVIQTLPESRRTPRERPDPELYEPARLRRSTPRHIRRDPYEVDVVNKKNKRGDTVMNVALPKASAKRVSQIPETKEKKHTHKTEMKQREPMSASAVLRITLMVLLGIALGVGLIFLDEWITLLNP